MGSQLVQSGYLPGRGQLLGLWGSQRLQPLSSGHMEPCSATFQLGILEPQFPHLSVGMIAVVLKWAPLS